jgi:DnaJ-class molecular chaperone
LRATNRTGIANFPVLIDPSKRALYDLYGPDCPELNQRAQIGFLLKTPQQLQEEYEERVRRENLFKLDQLIRQRV